MSALFPLISGALVILATIGLALSSYFIARKWLAKRVHEETEDLANSIILRTATLHALILAFIFAQEQTNVIDLRHATAREAAAVADIFYDLDRYHPEEHLSLRRALAHYVEVVLSEEWRLLAKGHLSPRAWKLWDEVYNGVLDLTPSNPRQNTLRERMLKDIETISESRNIRSSDYSSGVTALFWFVALSGIVFIALPYFIYPPRKINLLLIGLFAAYKGIILFTIFALSYPYSPPVVVSKQPFTEIYYPDMHALVNPSE